MRTLIMMTLVGCAMADRAVFHYFDVRGLGQAPRLMLSEVGLNFEEVRHTRETWSKAKQEGVESGLLSFGQVPAMEYWDGEGKKVSMVQSVAIMQFLAREHGLYGSDNAEKARIDVLVGGVGDLRKRYGAMAYSKIDKLEDALATYKEELVKWLPFFETYLSKGEHVVSSFSFADVMLFDLIDTCVLRVSPDALQSHPKLAAHHKLIASRPKIAAYLQSEKNHKFANGKSASWDTPDNVPAHLKTEEL
eukprot:TRINITY_DN36911_c0_g1_i1.p1 TRINITY_DN36911_c0_g1~~TRINITY_DN36911_c0_g1_i1.p1  ORF type:complete len:248 (+),score=60.32 TRINITY_DN36911_c0_g1_i1:43-786(+)